MAPVLDSKREGLMGSPLWLGLYSVVEFMSSGVLKSAPAVLREEAVPVSVSVLSDETGCEGEGLVCSMMGIMVVKDFFSGEADIDVIVCLAWGV